MQFGRYKCVQAQGGKPESLDCLDCMVGVVLCGRCGVFFFATEYLATEYQHSKFNPQNFADSTCHGKSTSVSQRGLY